MSVFRIEKNKNFTVMSNYHLRDKNLSLKAIGLLSKMLSLPEDWDYSLSGLTTICKDGLAAIRTALIELEKNGYIVRERQRSDHGYWGDNLYTIYEMPQVNVTPDERECDKRICENRIYEDRTCEDHIQISKDITNIKKEPKTEETKEACLLATTRAREEAVDELLSYVIDQIGRPLSNLERRTCVRWVEEGIDPRLIRLALEDNLFRDRFNLCYVDETLNKWKGQGITCPRDARNNILDNHVRNVSNMASEIAYRRYDDELADSIIQNNPTADLQGTRDYIIELFQAGRRESAVGMINSTYHKEILDYLPQEIVDYYAKHKED